MKSAPILRVVAVVLLGCAAIASIALIERLPTRHLLSLVGVSWGESGGDATPTPTTIATRTPLAVSERVSSLSIGSVAVQTFNGSVLVRSGSGTAVSSDGLVLTTSAVAPYGSGSYVYQVATSSGEVLRAKGVWRRDGLVLLQIAATDLSAVLFEEGDDVQAGREVLIVGALTSLSQYTPVILPATIPYITERDMPISFDRGFQLLLAGARVVDKSGRSLGIILLTTSHPKVVSAGTLNAFLEQYLAATQNKKK